MHQGVYAVGHVPLTSEARWMAAVFACGPGSVLSHLDAAALWKIYDGEGARVHVTTATRSGQRLPGLRIHRARRIDEADVTVRDGIPVTTVARTLVDLTEVLGRDRVLRALREADYLGLLDLDSLNAAVQRARGRRRLGVLRDALVHHRTGQIVRSEHEVAVELDGRAAHARAMAFEPDRARDAALNAIGLRPLRFTWYRVTKEAGEVIAELQATLDQSSAPSSRRMRRRIASEEA